jgi:hypothetical protein
MSDTPTRNSRHGAEILRFAMIGFALCCHPTARADSLAGSDPDLSVAAVKHWAECPLPKQSACVIRKPVDTGYRVLTPGANLDDTGEQWVADFTKLKDPRSPQLLLRVLGRGGELHEIIVKFPDEPLPPEKPAVKKKSKRKLSKPKPEKTS